MTNKRLTKKRAKKLPKKRDDEREMFNVLATDNVAFGEQLVQQIAQSVWYGDLEEEEQITKLVVSALSAIKQIAPRDELEGMLISQMIAAHNAAMECFRRSMISGQPFGGRDINLRHAEKLTKLYTEQVEALEKYRGKRHHKMTVEHVNVEPGGQAIVGDVHHSGGTSNSKKNDK